jgi:hypothetical protein
MALGVVFIRKSKRRNIQKHAEEEGDRNMKAAGV